MTTTPTPAPSLAKSESGALPTDGLIALLILYVLWGSTYLGIKFALISFPPFLLGATRFPLAGLLMFIVLKVRGVPNPTPRQWLHCAIYGVFLIGGGNGILAFAEQYLSSGLAAALLAVQPMVIALLAGLFGQWPTRLEWVGIAIGTIGVVLLNFDSQLSGNFIGVIALTVALLCWAFGSVLARYKLDLPSGPMTTSIELTAGGLLQLTVSLVLQERMTALDPRAAAGWVFLFIASIVGFTAYTTVLQKLRPALASSFSYVNPVVALALGALIGGEHVSIYAVVGVAVIVAGVVFISLAQQRKTSG